MPVIRLPDGVVRCSRVRGVEPPPHEHAVLRDRRVRAGLVRGDVVLHEVEPGLVVKAVDPRLRHGLDAVDGAEVVRLAVVVPGEDLGERDERAVLDEHLPALREEPVVAAVDEVLVVCVFAVVLSSAGQVSMGGDVRGGDGAEGLR